MECYDDVYFQTLGRILANKLLTIKLLHVFCENTHVNRSNMYFNLNTSAVGDNIGLIYFPVHCWHFSALLQDEVIRLNQKPYRVTNWNIFLICVTLDKSSFSTNSVMKDFLL